MVNSIGSLEKVELVAANLLLTLPFQLPVIVACCPWVCRAWASRLAFFWAGEESLWSSVEQGKNVLWIRLQSFHWDALTFPGFELRNFSLKRDAAMMSRSYFVLFLWTHAGLWLNFTPLKNQICTFFKRPFCINAERRCLVCDHSTFAAGLSETVWTERKRSNVGNRGRTWTVRAEPIEAEGHGVKRTYM